MTLTAMVVCPGRGTYNKEELGYLKRFHADKLEFIAEIDHQREKNQQITVSELDNDPVYKSRIHSNSENASALIYACAIADFMAINREKYEIVACCGNSMGWYLALRCGGYLNNVNGINVVNSMGKLMQEQGRGGQIIYPLVDPLWQYSSKRKEIVERVCDQANATTGVEVYTSIKLGGLIVLAANDSGLQFLMKNLPAEQNRYPLILPNHSAFHSPIVQHVCSMAKAELSTDIFQQATLAVIDGRGHIWQNYAVDNHALYDYTFDYQIAETYDFSKAIEVGIKEFAPDRIIVLGPGRTLGPPIAQELIKHQWNGLTSKEKFIQSQEKDPYVLSMGVENQRKLVV